MTYNQTRILVISLPLNFEVKAPEIENAVATKMVALGIEGKVAVNGLSTTRPTPGAPLAVESSYRIEVYNGASFNELWPWLKTVFGLTCAATWAIFHPGHPDHPAGFTEAPRCIEGRDGCKRI
jgi:hypothetical protein